MVKIPELVLQLASPNQQVPTWDPSPMKITRVKNARKH